MADTITLRLMGPDDLDDLLTVAPGLFDRSFLPDQAQAYLNDPSHLLVLAYSGQIAVGMASGQILLHPDKPPAFFVAEVGVREDWQRQGIAKRMCTRLMDAARDMGCKGIWLATEGDNLPAQALYRSLKGRETREIVVYDWDGAMDD